MNKINEKNNTKKLISSLKKLLGSENVLTSNEELYCYASDIVSVNKDLKLPDVVVLPENKDQVCEIMKLANQYNMPVVPRGAATNHVGGCLIVQGGIVIHFSKMNKILELDKENLTCKVQPGTVVDTIQKEAGKSGLYYPPDPSNLKVSTIGGSIVMSSSGPKCFKYGGTKEYVLGLEVVSADGMLMKTGSNTVKNATGYNLTQLFIGSEGTLGIVVEATLKLIPQPEEKKVMLVFFDSIDDAAKAVSAFTSNKITPATLDIMDNLTMRTVEQFAPTGLNLEKDACLIIEVDGFKESVERQTQQVKEICESFNSQDIRIAQTQEESDKIWLARRSGFAAVANISPDVITEDIVVPRAKIPEMVNKIKEIANKHKFTISILGHAGDGNLHPHFSLDLRNKDEYNRFKKAEHELFLAAIELGGTISAEHGIGLSKAGYLKDALDPQAIEYMKLIKKAFDPKGILNPRKVI